MWWINSFSASHCIGCATGVLAQGANPWLDPSSGAGGAGALGPPPPDYFVHALIATMLIVGLLVLWIGFAIWSFGPSIESGTMPSDARTAVYRRMTTGAAICAVLIAMTWLFKPQLGGTWDKFFNRSPQAGTAMVAGARAAQ